MEKDSAYLDTAIRAAREAAQIILSLRGGDLQVATKAHRADLVTRADRASEQRIREVIGRSFPGHVVLGEEEGAQGDDHSHRWLVDPLDGTLNYACGFPVYCVSIALEIDGELRVGVIHDPERDELFAAVRGQGATLNGAPLRVTRTARLRDAFLGTGLTFRGDPEEARETVRLAGEVMLQALGLRRPGAAALDLACVACGRYDGFWETALKPWDVAAGTLIVQEAGGRVSDGSGAPHRYQAPMIVATNGLLHDELLAVIQSA